VTVLLKLLLAALLGWSVGAWCVFVSLRGLRTGTIRVRGFTWERRRHPFMFWFNLIGSGLAGVFIIIVTGYLVMNP